MNYYTLVLCLTMLFLLFSCNRQNGEEQVFYNHPLNKKEFIAISDQFGMNELSIEMAIKIGLFFPEDTLCAEKINVRPKPEFDWFDLQRAFELPAEKAIYTVTSSLYRIFGDPTIPQKEHYDYSNPDLYFVLDSVKKGVWAPQCGGISNITARVFNELSKGFIAKSIEIDYLEHTLNVIYFKENKKWFAVSADIQNGYFFPAQNNSSEFYTFDTIVSFVQADKTYMLDFGWLSEKELNKKRNLLEQILPCNFWPDQNAQYHFTYEENNYAFERTGSAFHKHYWFDLQQADSNRLKAEIIDQIIKHFPK